MITEEISHWSEYSLIDSGDGMRLERFGDKILARPDPAVLWRKSLSDSEWQKADAVFESGWKILREMPERWVLKFDGIAAYASLQPFKHTGIFPEQAANWDFIKKEIAAGKKQKLKVLNLFGYTGVASVLCAKLGCEVTHVDASKPSLTQAKENMLLSGLPDDAIRWILDDALKFVKREARRGAKYDAILLDPPAFGRGAKGEVWKFNEDLPVLLNEIKKLLSDEFRFLIINAYAVSVSSLLLKNLLLDFDIKNATIDNGELCLKQESDGKVLSTGIYARLTVK